MTDLEREHDYALIARAKAVLRANGVLTDATWNIADIQHRFKEMKGSTITDDQAWEIASLMEREHDANIGISWEVIDIWVDYWLEENEIN